MPVTIHCYQCGSPKSLSPSAIKERNFCNRACFLEWRQADNRLVNCAYCGKQKEVIASYPERECYFCDTACMGKWQAENWEPEDHPRWRGDDLLVHCANCGAAKRTSSQKIRDHEYHFCNRKCKSEWMSENLSGPNNPCYKGKVIVECSWCNAPKGIYLHIAEMYEHHFCDSTCYGQWRSMNVSGENHPQYIGGQIYDYGSDWPRQARKARNRDGYRCRHCGISQAQNGRRLDVHHIIPFREFGTERYKEANQLSNLISLCRSCHKHAECGNTSIQPNLL